MKKIMEFLFGRKYPIFNTKGQIEHSQKKSFKKWEDFYNNNPEKKWKNHKGTVFKNES